MKTEYEITPMSKKDRDLIDTVATRLLEIEDENNTRLQVADIVRAHGLAAYIGGRHVAIHRRSRNGGIIPGRLAMVTHSSPDFN